ncbi:hypothetical protein TcasGA2_TC008715 [Tribolium castaneum]|uniref:Uncharacterized protein n=1 Tax=Tribolium castaneum TaxID=7070 RepID=D6WSK7_TRICA|nr:PREDICTED: uncharacterized protein LOC103313824 [Tribolium castaneum]EFA05902.2 hypothetical protein TcasGA2_TC008715 [Tribolium castaneum]|eukprot:XP_008196293.1 PREDICTED: uncharacterized protein LOC103313824 [Tribolium castaneum]
MTKFDLKKILLDEERKKIWKESVDQEEYGENVEIFEKLQKRNLEVVTKKNKRFASKQTRNVSKEGKISKKKAKKWREGNSDTKCPEVCVKELLLLIHCLENNTLITRKEAQDCIERQSSAFDLFWDSPTQILRLVRKCVLTQEWSKMTYLLLVLLNFDRKYINIIKNMVKIMIKFNPLIRESGLENQFKMLVESSNKSIII